MKKLLFILTCSLTLITMAQASEIKRLNDKQYAVLEQIADYVTAGGGESYNWQINPEKLAKFLSKSCSSEKSSPTNTSFNSTGGEGGYGWTDKNGISTEWDSNGRVRKFKTLPNGDIQELK